MISKTSLATRVDHSGLHPIIEDIFAGAEIKPEWWEPLRRATEDGPPRTHLAAARVALVACENSPEVIAWAHAVYGAAWSGEEAVFAQYCCGLALYYGAGIQNDVLQGLMLVQESANAGFAPAQVLIAQCWASGETGEKDPMAAGEWFDAVLTNPRSHPFRIILAWAGKASLAIGARKHEEAVQWYSRVIDCLHVLMEQSAMALVNRGVIHGQMGNLENEVADYTAVIGMRGVPLELRATASRLRGNYLASISRLSGGRLSGAIGEWLACLWHPCAAKEKSEVIAMLRQRNGLPTKTDGPAFAASRILIEALTGDPFAAIRSLDEIIQNARDADALLLAAREHRGYLWHLLGHDEAARADALVLLAAPNARGNQKEAAREWLQSASGHHQRLKAAAEAVGAGLSGLREGVRAMGPIYNQHTVGGIVIPGSRLPALPLPRPAFATCDAVWVDENGTLQMTGKAAVSSQDAFVWDDDVEVALILAFLEVPRMNEQPSFSLESPPYHPELGRIGLINFCEFTPDWLSSTAFGQTLFYCDYIFKLANGLLPPSLEDPTLFAPVGCLHPLVRLPDWLLDLRWCHNDPGISETWGRWCWKLRSLRLERRPVTGGLGGRNQGELFEIRQAEMYVETSLIRRHGFPDEDRKFMPDDERTFVGKQGAVMTRRYDGLCELFPAFSRLRELMKLYAALDAMRKEGVRLNPQQERRLRQARERYRPREMKTLFVPRFPHGSGFCYGGVTYGCADSRVERGSATGVPEGKMRSSGGSRGYAEIERETSVSNHGREVVRHTMTIEPGARYARDSDNKQGQREDAHTRAAFRREHELGEQEGRSSAFHVFASAFGADPTDKDNLVAGGATLNVAFYKQMENEVKAYVERTGQPLHATAEVTMADKRGFFRNLQFSFTDAEGHTPPELAKYTDGSNLTIANFPDHSTKESREFLRSTRGK